MKPRNLLILAAIITVIGIVLFSSLQDDSTYQAEIERERREKDRFMKTSDESPLPADLRQSFAGLSYFPPDLKYRILADLRPVRSPNVVILATNTGEEQKYIEYAYAVFTLDGVENSLLLLEIIDAGPARGKLFLAFGDETSADETYGGGRYLDVAKMPGASTITLDFNKAYNPYCAYNSTYSCPLPPSGNLLKVAIRAGEKNFTH